MAANDKLQELLAESIAAQNRTTHAVRALATFVLYQVAYSIVAGLFLGLGFWIISTSYYSSEQATGSFMVVIGGILIVVGFIHAFATAMSSLSKSIVAAEEKSSSAASGAAAWNSPSTERDPDESDFHFAQRTLSWKQMTKWQKHGEPSLKAWVAEGQPDFDEWLSRQ